LNDSQDVQRKQTTSYGYEGSPQEVGVELQDTAEALSTPPASTRDENDRQESKEALLEKILLRDNLNRAYKRVVANGGSHGVDGMTVDELLPYLKAHGQAIRQMLASGAYQPQPVGEFKYQSPTGAQGSSVYQR